MEKSLIRSTNYHVQMNSMTKAITPLKPYCVLCASSHITITLCLSVSTENLSSSFSGLNFWIVVKIIPPDGLSERSSFNFLIEFWTIRFRQKVQNNRTQLSGLGFSPDLSYGTTSSLRFMMCCVIFHQKTVFKNICFLLRN